MVTSRMYVSDKARKIILSERHQKLMNCVIWYENGGLNVY